MNGAAAAAGGFYEPTVTGSMPDVVDDYLKEVNEMKDEVLESFKKKFDDIND